MRSGGHQVRLTAAHIVTESFTQKSSTRAWRQVYRPYRKNSRTAISIRTRNAITFSPFQSRSQAGEVRFRGWGWGTGTVASERNSRISAVLRRSSVERRRDALTSQATIETTEPTRHVKYMAWSERNSLFQCRSRTITGNESAPTEILEAPAIAMDERLPDVALPLRQNIFPVRPTSLIDLKADPAS